MVVFHLRHQSSKVGRVVPTEVKVPASNTYDLEPRILTARPFYADFEMSTASWRSLTSKRQRRLVIDFPMGFPMVFHSILMAFGSFSPGFFQGQRRFPVDHHRPQEPHLGSQRARRKDGPSSNGHCELQTAGCWGPLTAAKSKLQCVMLLKSVK